MDAAGVNKDAPLELMAHYKFYFVFENVFGDPDWVSSTFFRALDAGTVPVVLGESTPCQLQLGLWLTAWLGSARHVALMLCMMW
jgi:hypothetical protein